MDDSSSLLKNAESSATEENVNSSLRGGVSDAREAEGEFKNSVTGITRTVKPKNVKAKIKKGAPLIAILVLLALVGGLIFLAQATMPFAIVSRLYEEFNTSGFTSIFRSDNILDLQLSSSEDLFGLTDYQKSSLEESDILNVPFGGGTVLFFENGNNNWTGVAGTGQLTMDSSTAVSDLIALYPELAKEKFTDPVLISTEEALNNSNFSVPYTSASKTWRGGNAGWYDTLATLNEQIRGLTRSRFIYTNTKALAGSSLVAADVLGFKDGKINKVINKFTGRSVNSYIQEKMAGTELGKMIGANSNIQSSSDLTNAGFTAAALLAAGSGFVNLGCSGVQLVIKAQNIIEGYQSLQQMNLTSGYAESVQWVQAGLNNGEAMNEYNENLLTPDPETGKNAMQSSGLGALMSGEKINTSSKSVQSASAQGALMNMSGTSSGRIVSDTLMGLASSGVDFAEMLTQCNLLSSAINLVSSVVTVGLAVYTGGLLGGAIELATTVVISFALNTVLGTLQDTFLPVVTEWIWDSFGKTLTQNAATDWLGEDLGNMLVAGGNRFIGSNHLTGGGSIATKETLLAYKQTQDVLVAKEAEYQRAVRSQFDATSEYTFLGSIVKNLIPVATSVSVNTTLKSVSSLLSNSVEKLLPSASAIANTHLIDQIGECPALDNIGAVGDPFCVPYMVTDVSTNTPSLTPEKLAEIVYNLGGISEPNPINYQVNQNSNFDKFVSYCGQRTSSFGMADAGVAESIQAAKESKWWRKIPIIGAIAGAVGDIMASGDNESWIIGEYCVARPYTSSCDGSSDRSCFWQNEGRYYQAFTEYQREAENMHVVEKSALGAYLEEKLENNPLDNSFEGILARYTGMTKDDVELALGFIYGLEYIANYDPSNRLAFGEEKSSETIFFEEIKNEGEDLTIVALEPKYIVFDTIRNRTTVI